MMGRKSVTTLLLIAGLLLIGKYAAGQRQNLLGIARNYVANNQPDSALGAYKRAYEEAPFDVKIYDEYLGLLGKMKKYDEAETLVNYMMQVRREDPAIAMDLVQVYEWKGEKRKAAKITDELIATMADRNDFDVKKAANAFRSKNQPENAIKVLEKAEQIRGSRGYFDPELMGLYIDIGEIEKALPLYARYAPYQRDVEAGLRSKLLMYLEKDRANKAKLSKILQKSASEPGDMDNGFYMSLLHWLNQQEHDQDGALDMLISMNEKEKGKMLGDIYTLGEQAMYNSQYSTAARAFEYILQDKNGAMLREPAYAGLIRSNYARLLTERPVNKQLVKDTRNRMEQFFMAHPDRKSSNEYLWYMDVIGKYDMDPESAISLLDSVINKERLSKDYIGYAKLALGDYHLLAGRMWDANLLYAQVDKMFRQDMLGEEARYKQAKLAFYRGDFEWAQTQLNVLKASTTELIANDAMNLSIMITENTVSDTSAVPLKMFAKADLMIFQYQFDSAGATLDQLLKEYGQNDLADDVLMLKAKMARDEGRFADAIAYFEKVIRDYGNDVLADDALMQSAEIYEQHLSDKVKAKEYYEKLIMDYPGSTLTGLARNRLSNMQSAAAGKP